MTTGGRTRGIPAARWCFVVIGALCVAVLCMAGAGRPARGRWAGATGTTRAALGAPRRVFLSRQDIRLAAVFRNDGRRSAGIERCPYLTLSWRLNGRLIGEEIGNVDLLAPGPVSAAAVGGTVRLRPGEEGRFPLTVFGLPSSFRFRTGVLTVSGTVGSFEMEPVVLFIL